MRSGATALALAFAAAVDEGANTGLLAFTPRDAAVSFVGAEGLRIAAAFDVEEEEDCGDVIYCRRWGLALAAAPLILANEPSLQMQTNVKGLLMYSQTQHNPSAHYAAAVPASTSVRDERFVRLESLVIIQLLFDTVLCEASDVHSMAASGGAPAEEVTLLGMELKNCVTIDEIAKHK